VFLAEVLSARTPSAGKFFTLAAGAALALISQSALAQSPTFAGNAQHTSVYSPAAQNLNAILWSTSIDQNNTGAATHYGAPLISNNNTVFAPVKIAGDGFQVNVLDGATGASRYTLSSDYLLPSHNWIPVYEPVLTTGPLGSRLYYAGAGGSVYYIDNPDSATPGLPVREVFYTDLATYTAGAAGYNGAIFIDTPITADSHGNIFFGFRVQGTAPAPLNTAQSGYARIDPTGVATYVLAGTAANDAQISRDCHNTAPALSNDGQTVYVVVKWANDAYYGYLLGLDSTTLATKYKVFLRDPRNGNPAGLLDDGTASPMVAPDNDVYLGIFGNPYNGSRGFLSRFNADLTVGKTLGGFGWDYTPGLVPASMVPSYTGTSSYLLFCKYNNYAINDGNGINRVAILDPNSTQTDPHPSAPGLSQMREVMTIIGPTTDQEYYPSYPFAVREWCINAPAVNPATNSVFFDSEDGHTYRWDLAKNQLSQSMTLTPGIGEPYVPTTIGPDGTVYTLNGGTLFALGATSGANFTLTSSAPDTTALVVGTPVTFTANVNNPVPGSTVTFTDVTDNGLAQESTTLASNVPVDAAGNASITTSSLVAGGAYFGNHWITATYSGGSSMTVVQKVHASASTTTVTSSANPSNLGQAVTFTANVASNPAGSGSPSGMVTFSEGSNVLAQFAVDANGNASYTASTLSLGSHTITVSYASDTTFAASVGTVVQNVREGTSTTLTSSPNPSSFGQTVLLSGHVSAADSSAGTPAGSISFSDGSNTLGSAVVDASGNASISTSGLTVGSHAIVATFNGVSGWQGSSSSPVQQTVQDATSSSISTSASPASYGQSVTLTAAVTGAGTGAGTPTGTVTFSDGSTVVGTAAVDGTGHAALSTTSLSVGSHSISASFAGTGGWQNSSSGSIQQLVQDGTTTNLASSTNPSNYGQAVTFTATVASADSGAGTPQGTVTFKEGSTTLGSAAVDGSGHATFSTSSLGFGGHDLVASFTGSTGWLGSTSAVLHQTVQDGTSTMVTSSRNPAVVGQSITFSASVSASDAGAGTPTGSVTFKDGATTLATVVLDGSGHASYTSSALAVGSHAITAAFVGTSGWNNSTGSLTQTVNADTTAPSVPGGASATSGPNRLQITVTWSPSTDPDDSVANYEVWSSASSSGTFSKLATVTGTSYTDVTSKKNTTRFYYIIAVDSHGNRSARSAIVSARSA
jgi:hypothetical protein